MKWNSDFAYCVGLITTDGNLSKDGRHIELTSKDIEQIQSFAKALHLTNKIGIKSSSYNPKAKYYRIQFGNAKLYRYLMRIGLTPNKTKTLGSLSIPDKFFADFLRGHLDGDGFTFSYWDKRWKKSFMLYTGFTSASIDHLNWIKENINRLYNIDGKINFTGKSLFHLMYAKKASILLLGKMYHRQNILCLSRKKFKIDRALDIIGQNAGMLKLVYRHA